MVMGTGNTVGIGNKQILRIAIFVDQKAANTVGGNFTQDAWRTRTLNTEQYNNISGCSVTANQITLPAGTYSILAFAPAFSVDQHKAKLYNITDSADELIGSSEDSQGGSETQTISTIQGVISTTDTKVFEVQHYCASTDNPAGFGIPSNFGVVEIYTTLKINKII